MAHVGFHRFACWHSGRLGSSFQNIAQNRRVARTVEIKSRPAQNEMDCPAQSVALAQRLVPAEFAFIAILPAPARGGFNRLNGDAKLAAELEEGFRLLL